MELHRSAVLSSDKDATDRFSCVLVEAGYDNPRCLEDVGVAKLGIYAPCVLMVDFDHIRSDRLESIRQLRFVLPDCAIVVVSSNLQGTWARMCHMAGANAVLSSRSGAKHISRAYNAQFARVVIPARSSPLAHWRSNNSRR